MLIEKLSQSITLFGLGMGTVFVLLVMLIGCVTMLSIGCRYWAKDGVGGQPVITNDQVKREQVNQSAVGGKVSAPLSASILEVCVEKDAYVDEGDIVMRLEAMKMETEVRANCSGKVSEIHAKAGDSVESGQAIITLASSVIHNSVNHSQPLSQDNLKDSADEKVATGKNIQTINAPLSADVIDVCVELNGLVKEGDVVVTLEAMKMETEVCADCEGNVSEIHIKKGDSINAGQIILTLI